MTERTSTVVPAPVTKVIHHFACQAACRFLQFGHSRQDLEQELTLHFLQHSHQHNAKLASAATFAARVCRNRIISMLERESASVRRASGGVTWLTEQVTIGPAGETVERATRISADMYWMETGRQTRPASELQILAIDLKRVLDRLPPELVSVVRLLAEGETPAEAATILDISRATIYRRMVRLRAAFRDAGFESHARLQETA